MKIEVLQKEMVAAMKAKEKEKKRDNFISCSSSKKTGNR